MIYHVSFDSVFYLVSPRPLVFLGVLPGLPLSPAPCWSWVWVLVGGPGHEAVTEATTELSSQRVGTIPLTRRRAIVDLAAWCRDTLYALTYALIGHLHGATITRQAHQTLHARTNQSLNPRWYTAYDDFKLAAETAAESAQQAASDKYRQLLRTNPHQAETFISKYFKAAEAATMALADEHTGATLPVPTAIHVLVQDLVDRGSNDNPQDQAAAAATTTRVENIRRAHAAVGSVGLTRDRTATTARNRTLYSQGEVDIVLDKLKFGKASVRGCYEAVGARQPEGRELTRALMNIARAGRVTSRLWSSRRITPIRKCGPKIVRKVSHTRPISQGTDFASVQDALWLARCQDLLDAFTGPGQVGGKSGAVLLLLALVLLTEIREYQGLDTYCLCLDLKWAFDTVPHQNILLACFEAGVVETEWEMLDDMVAQDHQFVQLGSFLSTLFRVAAGTAQGRRYSMPTFDAVMTGLRDDINDCTPCIKAKLPTFANRLLEQAENLSAASHGKPSPSRDPHIEKLCEKLRSIFLDDHAPWDKTQSIALNMLVDLPLHADRVRVLEHLGSVSIPPLQYVDDTTVLAPSIGAAAAVSGEACEAFSLRTKMTFNCMAGKSAIIPMFSSPQPLGNELTCSVSQVHRSLGVAIDSELTMNARLTEVVNTCNSLMQTVLCAALSGGFPLPVVAKQVECRIDPVALYAAELLVLHDDAEKVLNAAQQRWALSLLGCTAHAHVTGSLAVVHCGWRWRLGTKFLECAILARARINLLPLEHPARKLMALADALPAITWSRRVKRLMATICPESPLPDVTECSLFSNDALDEARASNVERKKAVKNYRDAVIRPALLDYDRRAYGTAASKVFPAFGVPFAQFQPKHYACAWGVSLLTSTVHAKIFRAWSVARISGKWPLTVLGEKHTSVTLEFCPFCGQPDVTITHTLLQCNQVPGDFRKRLVESVPSLDIQDPVGFLNTLFATSSPLDARLAHIQYTGGLLLAAMPAFAQSLPDGEGILSNRCTVEYDD